MKGSPAFGGLEFFVVLLVKYPMRKLVGQGEEVTIRPPSKEIFVHVDLGTVRREKSIDPSKVHQPRHRNDVQAEFEFYDSLDRNRNLTLWIESREKIRSLTAQILDVPARYLHRKSGFPDDVLEVFE